MPEANTANPDTRAAAPNGEGSPEAHAEAGVTDLSEFMGGKFEKKTLKDVEEAMKEGQSAKVRAEQEAAELRRQLELKSSEQSIGAQVAEALKVGMQPGVSPEERRKEWVERLSGDDGADATIDLVTANADALKGEVTGKLTQELEGLKATLEDVKNGLATAKEQSDPTYRDNQAEIDEMATEYGMTSAKATKLYKDRFEEKAPGSPPAPGESGVGASRSSEQVAQDSAKQADTDKRLGDLGFTAEEIASA